MQLFYFVVVVAQAQCTRQQTTNNKQQTTNNKQQTTNNKQQTTNNNVTSPRLFLFLVGRGGQSAARFGRLRMEKRHNYVRKVAEEAVRHFITDDKVRSSQHRPATCTRIVIKRWWWLQKWGRGKRTGLSVCVC